MRPIRRLPLETAVSAPGGLREKTATIVPRSRPIVDRDRELNTFVTSLASPPHQAPSILFIEDVSGQGKTRLLERYSEHCRECIIPVAHIDLKGGSLSPIDVLRIIQTDLRPLSLPRCAAALKTPLITPPSFQISDNKSVGQSSYTMQAHLNVAGMSRDEQRQWWAASAQALFDDLNELACTTPLQRLAFLFDTFESVINSDTGTWITDHVLRMATPSRISCLIIVVAGKQLPDPTSEWERYCQTLPLQPLQLEDWLRYAELVKSSLSYEQIRQCYAKYAARPLKMAEIIDTFAGQGVI